MNRRIAIIGLVILFFIGTYLLFHTVHHDQAEAISLEQAHHLVQEQLGGNESLQVEHIQKTPTGKWKVDVSTDNHKQIVTYHINSLGKVTYVKLHVKPTTFHKNSTIEIYELKN